MTQPPAKPFRGLILWAVLFLLCIGLQYFELSPLLRFDRTLIDAGAWWLLLSGNVVHLGWHHLWLNMAGLALVAVFFNAYYGVLQWLGILLLSAVFVGLGLYYFNPELMWYVGLSGVLHGLFISGGWQEYKHHGKSGALLLVLIIGKLAWEQIMGAMPGSEAVSGGRVMVDAHLYGALAGFVFIGFYIIQRRYFKN